MSAAKLTPGPWRAVHYEKVDVWDVVAPLPDEPDVEDNRYSLIDPPSAADARLIAAAPDLLEALVEVERLATRNADYIGQDGQHIKRVRAAIAKARGAP
jgi:hypothetical protein